MSGVATLTWSTSRPSEAAHICTSTVSEPCPLSTAPVFSTAVPSSRRRTMAPEVSTPRDVRDAGESDAALPARSVRRRLALLVPSRGCPDPLQALGKPGLVHRDADHPFLAGPDRVLEPDIDRVHAELVRDLVDLGFSGDGDLRGRRSRGTRPTAACWCRPGATRWRRSRCDRARGRTAPRSRPRRGCRRHRRRPSSHDPDLAREQRAVGRRAGLHPHLARVAGADHFEVLLAGKRHLDRPAGSRGASAAAAGCTVCSILPPNAPPTCGVTQRTFDIGSPREVRDEGLDVKHRLVGRPDGDLAVRVDLGEGRARLHVGVALRLGLVAPFDDRRAAVPGGGDVAFDDLDDRHRVAVAFRLEHLDVVARISRAGSARRRRSLRRCRRRPGNSS